MKTTSESEDIHEENIDDKTIEKSIDELMRRWSKLEYPMKCQEINEAILKVKKLNSDSGSMETTLSKSCVDQIKLLNDSEKKILLLKSDLNWFTLKKTRDLSNLKFFLSLPRLSKIQKTNLTMKITQNSGIIKTNSTSGDYFIISPSILKESEEEQDSLIKFIKDQENYKNDPAFKESMPEFNTRPRIMKHIQQSSQTNGLKEVFNAEFKSLFEFLQTFNIITLDLINDILNRHDSWKGDHSWFLKRIDYSPHGENPNLSPLFCIASFGKKTNQYFAESMYESEYHEFERIPKEKTLKSKQKSHLYSNSNDIEEKYEALTLNIPLFNINAPRGTSLFQTFQEYDVGNQNIYLFEKKHSEAVSRARQLQGKAKHFYKEPHPADHHNYCFLCRAEFENYIEHIESVTHKNSVHLQPKGYEQIDFICDQLFEQLPIQKTLETFEKVLVAETSKEQEGKFI